MSTITMTGINTAQHIVQSLNSPVSADGDNEENLIDSEAVDELRQLETRMVRQVYGERSLSLGAGSFFPSAKSEAGSGSWEWNETNPDSPLNISSLFPSNKSETDISPELSRSNSNFIMTIFLPATSPIDSPENYETIVRNRSIPSYSIMSIFSPAVTEINSPDNYEIIFRNPSISSYYHFFPPDMSDTDSYGSSTPNHIVPYSLNAVDPPPSEVDDYSDSTVIQRGSLSGYESGGPSNEVHNQFDRNTSFRSSGKSEYLELDKMKLLRMVSELQDELSKRCYPGGMPNGRVSTLKDKHIPSYYDHEAAEEVCHDLSYPRFPRRSMQGSSQLQQSNSSHLPFSGETTRSRHQAHHSCQHLVKRHFRPIAGGAPIISCYICLSPLQLPADFVLSRRTFHLRCGACSNLLKFSLQNSTRMVPYSLNAVDPPPSEDDNYSYSINGRLVSASHSHANACLQADPVSCSDDYGLSYCKSGSTEADPVSITSFHALQGNLIDSEVVDELREIEMRMVRQVYGERSLSLGAGSFFPSAKSEAGSDSWEWNETNPDSPLNISSLFPSNKSETDSSPELSRSNSNCIMAIFLPATSPIDSPENYETIVRNRSIPSYSVMSIFSPAVTEIDSPDNYEITFRNPSIPSYYHFFPPDMSDTDSYGSSTPNHIVPYSLNAVDPPPSEVNDYSDSINRRLVSASHSHDNACLQADPVSCSDDYGLSYCKSGSTEADPVSITSFHDLQGNINERNLSHENDPFKPMGERKKFDLNQSQKKQKNFGHDTSRPSSNLYKAEKLSSEIEELPATSSSSLHQLMGYSSSSQVINGSEPSGTRGSSYSTKSKACGQGNEGS